MKTTQKNQPLEEYRVSVKMEYRVDVTVRARNFEDAFEKAAGKAGYVDFSEYEYCDSEPVHAERSDGQEADYGYHPYKD